MSSDGAAAEQYAADFLIHEGLLLVARNYRSRFGEIDLIMRDGDTLVFVEVRLRRNARFGGAAASIDPRKQRRLILTAQGYLARLPKIPPCRFDAILLDNAQGRAPEWLKNAFEA
ncbi:MAG: YraN family protein [Gallionella sp.]|nr:YraN family protein [Gallionella sp.]